MVCSSRTAAWLLGFAVASCLVAACSGAADSTAASTTRHESAANTGHTAGHAAASTGQPPANAAARRGPLSALAFASITVRPPGKATARGNSPAYTRLVAGTVTGLGANLRLSAVFADTLPARMPSHHDYLIVAWNISGDAHHRTVGFTAQATNTGWTV